MWLSAAVSTEVDRTFRDTDTMKQLQMTSTCKPVMKTIQIFTSSPSSHPFVQKCPSWSTEICHANTIILELEKPCLFMSVCLEE